jgi:hypothetical protein
VPTSPSQSNHNLQGDYTLTGWLVLDELRAGELGGGEAVAGAGGLAAVEPGHIHFDAGRANVHWQTEARAGFALPKRQRSAGGRTLISLAMHDNCHAWQPLSCHE